MSEDKRKDDLGDLPDFLRESVQGGGKGAGSDADADASKAKAEAKDEPKAQTDGAGGPEAGPEVLAQFDLGAGDGGAQDVDLDDLSLDEAPEEKSKFGLVLLISGLVILAVGLGVILTNKKMRDQLEAFFTGDVAKYKMAEKKVWEDRFKEMERQTKPFYGDVTLVYYPQDAKVEITETIKVYDSFKDYKAGKVARTETKKIPNRTEKLEPGEIVKQLPLKDLPVRTREFKGGKIKKGKAVSIEDMKTADIRVFEHAYDIVIQKEGYKPRSFHFDVNDWEKLGPAVNAVIQFQGADLEPEPETMKKNLVEAEREMYCLRQFVKDRAKLLEYDKQIQVRHHFKTTEEYERISEALKQDVEWWAKVWKEQIEKPKCQKPDYL